MAMVWRMFIGILWRRMLLLMAGFPLIAGVGIDDLAKGTNTDMNTFFMGRYNLLSIFSVFRRLTDGGIVSRREPGLSPVAQVEEPGTGSIITGWTHRMLTGSLCGGHECTTLRMWMWIFRFTGLLALRGCRVRGSHRWLWAFYMPRALGGIWSRFRHIRGVG